MTPLVEQPLTKTAVHVEEAPSFSLACAALQKWIVEHELCKEQILGISATETTQEDGNAILNIVYKTVVDVTGTSLKDIKLTLVSNVKSWED